MRTLDPVLHGTRPAGTTGSERDRLVDWLEIRELSARYNRAVDDCRYEEFANCFTPDGVFDVIGLMAMEGREEILRAVPEFGFGPVHLTTDATIEIDGNRATQICTVVVGGRQRNRAAFRFLTTGRYHDELVRTPNGWRFERRTVDTDLEITQMAASIAAENFAARALLQGGARLLALVNRLRGKQTRR